MTDLTGNFEIQQLLFHAGVSVEMDYGPDGSGADGGPFSPLIILMHFLHYKKILAIAMKCNGCPKIISTPSNG